MDRLTLSSAIVDLALPDDVVTDLLRSAALVERGRAALFRRWSGAEERYSASAHRAERRAELIAAPLAGRTGRDDSGLVEPHAAWIAGLLGAGPGDDPWGHAALVRLGDWAEAHASPFVDDPEGLRALGDEERAALTFPPVPVVAESTFEPVPAAAVTPPSEPLFRFAILGDTHFGSEWAEATARAAIAGINASGSELVVQLGDITDRGERRQFESARRTLSSLEMPSVTMLGNHDVVSYEEGHLTGREYFTEAFGRPPEGTVFDHGGFRFAVLDSAEHLASPFPDFDLVAGAFTEGPGGGIVRGSLTIPQHEILAEVAAPGAPPAFVFLHHPVQPFTAFPPVLFGLRDADSGRLHAVCESGNVWGVFSGHTHRNARTRMFGRIPCHEVAIPRDFPFGYALVDVTDQGYAYRFVQLPDEDLLRAGYARSGGIQRRYALGADSERAFVWHRPP